MSFRDRTYEEERNWAYEEERRQERERQHAPAHVPLDDLARRLDDLGRRHPALDAVASLAANPPIGPDPILLMVVQVPDGITIGEVVQAVGRQAVNHGVTLMLWDGKPRRRHRRAMKLLFGRKLGKRLTG